MRLLLILSMLSLGAACSSPTTPKCSTSTCTGCCDSASGECLSGNVESGCGSGGLVCTQCGTDTFCNVGFCVPRGSNTGGGNGGGSGGGGAGGGSAGGGGGTSSCGPQTCGGCCVSGVCQPGNTAAACGSGGQACGSCNGGTCVNNQCTGSTCNSSNCQGCCNGNRCETGLTIDLCGARGATCSMCGRDQTCDNGLCQGGSTSCSPENCAGCCVGNVCQTGSSTSACGLGGLTCGVCASGQTCSEGRCAGGNICNATTCPTGCCEAGVCRSGTSISACGTAGGTCSTCSGSDSCAGGQCRFICNASTCPGGCCANNVCQPSNNNTCGTGGGECDTCTSSESCSAGLCVSVSTCNVTTCPSGCCQGNVCQAGTSLSACGSGGNTCSSCGSNQTCNGSSCVAACNSTTCPTGCCQGSVCQAGTMQGACGSGGNTCSTCSSNQACNGSSCVATCNSSTCPSGCCQGDVCQAGTSSAACGFGGLSCSTCSGAQTCSGGSCSGGGLTGDRCDTAPLLTLPATVNHSLSGYSNDFISGTPNNCRGTQGLDRVVRVSVPAGQRLTVTVTPTVSTFDPTVSLVTGAASACVGATAMCVAAIDTGIANEAETVSWTNSGNTAATVFIIVDDYTTTGTNGSYTLSASTAVPPSGENCAAPVNGTSGVAVSRTPSNFTDDYQGASGGCLTPSTGPDFVVAYTVPNNRSLTVTATPASGLDISLNFATSLAACGARTCVASASSGGTGGAETTGWNNTSGATLTVYVIIDTTGTPAGAVSVVGTEGALLGCGGITCPNGCCSASGACVAGTSDSACGTNGVTCSTCSSPAQCSASQTCSATNLATGSVCTASSQCYQPIFGAAECRTSWPGGYCTGQCFFTDQACGGIAGLGDGYCTPAGECLEECPAAGLGQSTCRAGYLCDYSGAFGSQGVCRPRCQLAPCSAGTCNTSGYCR